MTTANASTDPPADPSVPLEPWTSGRILILGMTYPHYSGTYTENACTGGILEQTGELVRVHPMPQRYLAYDSRPKTFQWMRVRHRKHESDPRPESLRIDPSSITCEDLIASTEVDERRGWLVRCSGLLRSVEEVKRVWTRRRTSLAIIQPAEILNVTFERRSESERKAWRAKEKSLLAQERIAAFIGSVKPIDFPETRFMVKWRCDDAECSTHEMGVEDWGIHELWRKLAGDPDRESKVLESFANRLDLEKREVFFYLGNFRTTLWNFGLMGMSSLRRTATPPQLSLF